MSGRPLMLDRISDEVEQAVESTMMAMVCCFPKCGAAPVKMLSAARNDGSRTNFLLCKDHANLVEGTVVGRRQEERQGIYFYGVVKVGGTI